MPAPGGKDFGLGLPCIPTCEAVGTQPRAAECKSSPVTQQSPCGLEETGGPALCSAVFRSSKQLLKQKSRSQVGGLLVWIPPSPKAGAENEI